MSNRSEYSSWKTPEAPLAASTIETLRGLYSQLYRQHWGPAKGTEDLVATFQTIIDLVRNVEGASKRLCSVLATTAAQCLEGQPDAQEWARRALIEADNSDVAVRSLKRYLTTPPEGSRATGDAILAIESFLMLVCSHGSPDDHVRTILDLCCNGMAILPGTRGQRELWNWLLIAAVPWAINPHEADPPMFDAQVLLEAHQAPRRPRAFKGLFSSVDWSQSARNVYTDFHGDWYADRWTWPELLQLVSERHLQSTISKFSGAPTWSIPVRVPKAGGGYRPAVLLSPRDRLYYQVIVDSLVPVTSQRMKPWAFGWKAVPNSGHQRATYARRDEQWETYVAKVRSAATKYGAALHIDIHQYFASIPLDGLLRKLEHGKTSHHHEAIEALHQFLRSWQGRSSQSGLPQRCLGSSLLADFYLRDLDDYLDSLSVDKNCTTVRWMDDIWIFASDDAMLERVNLEVRDRLAAEGLFKNAEKSAIYSREGVLAQLSAVHIDEPADSEIALTRTVERVVQERARASRTLIRFACRCIKEGKRFGVLRSIMKWWWDLQHGSDHIASAGKDWADRASLADAFLQRLHECNPLTEWALGNYANLFAGVSPSAERKLVDLVADGSRGSALRALGVSVLAGPHGVKYADILADAGTSLDDALVARSVALTLNSFGGKYQKVAKDILRGFEELAVLESHIETGGDAATRLPPLVTFSSDVSY